MDTVICEYEYIDHTQDSTKKLAVKMSRTFQKGKMFGRLKKNI